MRHALVSLIAATALAVSGLALAQEATPAVPPAPAETPAAPAPTTVPAADPSTPAVPALETPPAPAPEAAAVPAPDVAPIPVPVPAPEPVAPPPPPAVPTDPTTIRVLNVLESLCKPLVQGGDVEALTKQQGFKKKRDVYVLALTKPYSITLTYSATNKDVCMVDIDHSVGGDQPLTVGLHDWAIARGYTLYRNDEFTTDLKRHTRSWELTTGDKTEALVLTTSRTPDGSPLTRNADHTTLMYSVR